MKREAGAIDATPSKKIYASIIADYSLNTGICELVDNSIDQWTKTGRSRPLIVAIGIDVDQQSILVQDDAGGVGYDDLVLLVTPGATGSSGSEEQIGIFGVGSKRAVVALGQQIKIFTRTFKSKTHLVEYDDQWLSDNDWHLGVFQVNDISAGSTVVDISKLRARVDEKDLASLREHLGTTYAMLIEPGRLQLSLNDDPIEPRLFDNWAFPPEYCPRRFSGTIYSEDGDRIELKAMAGLINGQGSISGEYGVYFYCNDRLVARSLKTQDVGFVAGLAGGPHNVVSLVRVLVYLNGPARSMPWNSSKSAINVSHRVFKTLQEFMMGAVTNFASVCKRFHGDWEDKVFQYHTGKFVDEKIVDFGRVKRSFLPKLPPKRPNYSGALQHANSTVIDKKPWVKGHIETDVAVELLQKQKLDQKNRLSLILLDSTLEIAYKDFLVNESGAHYSDAKLVALFHSRHDVQQELQKYVPLKPTLLKKLKFYYGLRCKLIHERSTAGIADHEIDDFRKVVHRVLTKLFGIHWRSGEQSID